MTRSVLFVCLGNICRSPAAEAIFAARMGASGITHDSAGTAGWHQGKPPYGPMTDAASARAISMDHLRARQFTTADFQAFDLIIGMDDDNLSAIRAQRPQGNSTRLASLLDYAPQTGLQEVPDPYYTRDFETALDLIEAGIEGLIKAEFSD